MVQTAGTVFLAWALTRELDPDQPVTAVVAAVGAGTAVVITGQTSLIALASLTVATRILTRSTGSWPLMSDLAVVGVLAGVLARTPLAWAAGMALAAAIAVDTTMTRPAPARHIWLALATGVAVTVTAVVSDALTTGWQAPGTATIIIASAAAVLGVVAPLGPITSVGDHRNLPLEHSRVLASRRLAVGALVMGTLTGGGQASEASWPGWAALVAVGVVSRLRWQR